MPTYNRKDSKFHILRKRKGRIKYNETLKCKQLNSLATCTCGAEARGGGLDNTLVF